jgi:hypothetical protein
MKDIFKNIQKVETKMQNPKPELNDVLEARKEIFTVLK